MSRLSSRAWFFIGFLVCTGLILIALFLQYYVHLEPCPLCMLQRVAFIVLGIVFLIGALHGPGKTGSRIYAVLCLIPGLTGLGLAVRHTWLQYNPPEYVSCAGDFYSQLERMPLGRLISNALRATGDCSKVDWTLFKLSIAEWSLIWFAILAILALYVLIKAPSRN
jgi:disulfide bond formation protein DsbB